MKEIKETVLHFFEEVPHIVAIFLFGSYAQGTENSKSDIDIAILFEKSHVPSPLELIAWREDLSGLTQKDIDLVCLNTASPIIGMQVYKNGKILIEKKARELSAYLIALFTDYAELKELRAPMEKEILKRKFYDRP